MDPLELLQEMVATASEPAFTVLGKYVYDVFEVFDEVDMQIPSAESVI